VIVIIIKINEIERDSCTYINVGKIYFLFYTKYFSLSWFVDCGEWFSYVVFGKYYFRFSGAGFMKGKTDV